jgi:hypothetical protein
VARFLLWVYFLKIKNGLVGTWLMIVKDSLRMKMKREEKRRVLSLLLKND